MTFLVNLIERLTADRKQRGRWQATPSVMRTHQAHFVGKPQSESPFVGMKAWHGIISPVSGFIG